MSSASGRPGIVRQVRELSRSMQTRRNRRRHGDQDPRRHDESGAVIILALVFLVSVSLIVTGLLTWVGTSVHATANFTDQRNREFTATSAFNFAIQSTRYTFDAGTPTPFLNNATPELCTQFPVGAPTVDVYCSMVWQPSTSNTRQFTYSACDIGAANNATPADCAAKPILQAVVAFDDYPPGLASPSSSPTKCTSILPSPSSPSGNGSCGMSMTQLSWQWYPTVPAVTSVSPSAGSINGDITVTIKGTGFTSGETVNFVEQPQEVPTGTYNPQIPATIVTNPPAGCSVPTCIQVTSPGITVGRAYFVIVTTPWGSSQTGTNDYTSFVPTFTYSPVAPTVTGITGVAISSVTGYPSGSINGNTLMTVQGTGFWNAPNNTFPAQAFMCPTSGGTPVSTMKCSNGIAAPVVSLSPPVAPSTTSTMAVLAPAVTATGNYFVQVEVFNVYSVQTGAIFSYSVQVPLIISMSTSPTPTNPTSGGTGTTLTMSGANFLPSVTTVAFCPTAKYTSGFTCSVTATPATVVGTITPTQISVTIPNMAAGSYFPIISLPASYGTPSSQAYNQSADIFTHT